MLFGILVNQDPLAPLWQNIAFFSSTLDAATEFGMLIQSTFFLAHRISIIGMFMDSIRTRNTFVNRL